MSIDDVRRRFIAAIQQRGHDDHYIDATEEAEILASVRGSGLDDSVVRAALVQVCLMLGYAREMSILEVLADLLAVFAGNDGLIEEKEFADSVAFVLRLAKGKRNPAQAKRMVLLQIDHGGHKAKTAMFSNWYTAAKKEVGL